MQIKTTGRESFFIQWAKTKQKTQNWEGHGYWLLLQWEGALNSSRRPIDIQHQNAEKYAHSDSENLFLGIDFK